MLRQQLAALSNSSAAQLGLSISSHSVSAAIVLMGAHSSDSWGAAVQSAFVAGVAADCGVSPTAVAVSLVRDTADFSGLDVRPGPLPPSPPPLRPALPLRLAASLPPQAIPRTL